MVRVGIPIVKESDGGMCLVRVKDGRFPCEGGRV